ncbi:serine/threonine-protein phosphatase 7 long form homolog [Abrus precatorius]|uniref:Serine/threonine-protein phosphatase 7 long form homolog n=1 Tax=Abrus precatorius TaxID=3816 RepID=A0A8B8M2A1_ABRPR|nr:serine/threonine-protein phosphatase 7 long form homolog [Abrus precatorius]
MLRVRKSQNIHGGLESVSQQIITHLELVSFIGMTNLSQFFLDVGLITTLVEKWRPETYTFYLPPRECTITLQNVAILLGLCIDERLVIAPIGGDWAQIVEDSLSIESGQDAFLRSFLKMSWLDEHFNHIGMYNQNALQIAKAIGRTQLFPS